MRRVFLPLFLIAISLAAAASQDPSDAIVMIWADGRTLGTGFFTYFLAVTTDQRFWKFIPAEKIFHTTLEESLELIGHVILGGALFFATRNNAHN